MHVCHHKKGSVGLGLVLLIYSGWKHLNKNMWHGKNGMELRKNTQIKQAQNDQVLDEPLNPNEWTLKQPRSHWSIANQYLRQPSSSFGNFHRYSVEPNTHQLTLKWSSQQNQTFLELRVLASSLLARRAHNLRVFKFFGTCKKIIFGAETLVFLHPGTKHHRQPFFSRCNELPQAGPPRSWFSAIMLVLTPVYQSNSIFITALQVRSDDKAL